MSWATFIILPGIGLVFAIIFTVVFFLHRKLRYHIWFAAFALAAALSIASSAVVRESGHLRTVISFHNLTVIALMIACYAWSGFVIRLLALSDRTSRMLKLIVTIISIPLAVIALLAPLGIYIRGAFIHAERFIHAAYAGPWYLPVYIGASAIFTATLTLLIVNYMRHRLSIDRRFGLFFILASVPLPAVTCVTSVVLARGGEVSMFVMGYGLTTTVALTGYWLIYNIMHVYDDLHRSHLSISYFLEKTRVKNREMIQALATTLEMRDKYTAGHSERVRDFAFVIARELSLDNETRAVINTGCILHDIGKIGVSENILNKPSMLDYEEYQDMKKHVSIGRDMLSFLEDFIPYLEIIYYHHERIDGRGYPERLKGESIPLLSRIVAVADTFDALTSDRVYRKGVSFDKGCQMLLHLKGTQLDGPLVDIFVKKISSIYGFPIDA
ncbi:MAG: HD-GYP domain-containing protein [Spirochaetota bacterium]